MSSLSPATTQFAEELAQLGLNSFDSRTEMLNLELRLVRLRLDELPDAAIVMLVTLSVPLNGVQQLGVLFCERLPDAADLPLCGSGHFVDPARPKRAIIEGHDAIDHPYVIEEEPSLVLRASPVKMWRPASDSAKPANLLKPVNVLDDEGVCVTNDSKSDVENDDVRKECCQEEPSIGLCNVISATIEAFCPSQVVTGFA